MPASPLTALSLAFTFLITLPLHAADPLDARTKARLKKLAPLTAETLDRLEAEKPTHEEMVHEIREHARHILREFAEREREETTDWATIHTGFEDADTAIDFARWQLELERITRPEAKRLIKRAVEKRFALHTREMRLELEHLKEELRDLEDEIRYRETTPEDVEEDILHEVEEILDGREEEEEEGEHEEEGEEHDEDDEEDIEPDDDDLSGPVYTPPPAGSADPDADLAGVSVDFDTHVLPALQQYCFDCHYSDYAKGDVDLEAALAQKPLVRNAALWRNVAERVRTGDMPPAKKPQPADGARTQLRAWVHTEVENFDYAAVRNPGHAPPRRLTREEYNRTIRDLTGLDLRPADAFPMDFSGTSGFSNSANTLFLQTAHLDRYMTAADDVIDAVRADPAAWAELAGTAGPNKAIKRFLTRAYRRQPDDAQAAAANSVFATARKSGRPEPDALADAFKFALISPDFLLRTEAPTPSGADHPVSDHDLATRLSYFLWASTPDDALLAAADAGELSNPATRRAHVERLLADPRSDALGVIFAGEWLRTDDVGPRIRKDPIDQPWCTESLMAAMRQETALFVHSLITDNAPVARLLDADYTFLNAELARFYKIPDIDGDHMRRVDLVTTTRGGLLGHAAVLATTSFPDRTSPVVRGTWILETLLGTPPPPPPPDVPEIDVDGGGRRAALSLRRKLEIHRESPQCASCHDQIDPLGFALESYAEFGQWRPGVDSRGSLPNGAKFRGPEGLRLALIDTRLDDLGTQVVRKMLAYALGRQLEFYDEGTVRDLAADLKPDGYRLRDLVFAITESYPFTTKRLPQE